MSELKSKWYTVRVATNRERSVKERLQKEKDKNGHRIDQIVLPIEKAQFLRNGKKILREQILYPGYIFIQTSAPGEIKHLLKEVDGATGFLTDRSGNIIPLSQREIDQMLLQEEKSIEKALKNPFSVGEEVKVVDGPFSSFVGVITEINEEKNKVKLDVMIFGRKTPVDLNLLQIAKN